MPNVIVYTTASCGYCEQAKRLLDRKGIAYQEIDVTDEAALRDRMVAASGRRTLPQIFIGGTPIGGFAQLKALDDRGELDGLLGGDRRGAR